MIKTEKVAVITKPDPVIFIEEFDSLDLSKWTAKPSLKAFPGNTGSRTPGEVKCENGVLKLSRYAWERAGKNPTSSVRLNKTLPLPESYHVSVRFRNQFISISLGELTIQ